MIHPEQKYKTLSCLHFNVLSPPFFFYSTLEALLIKWQQTQILRTTIRNSKKKMMICKILLASITIALLIIGSTADGHDHASEVEALRLKIFTLESSIVEKIHEIKSKDDSIIQLNDIIQGKISTIESLKNEIQSLKEKSAVDAHVVELENQIMILRKEIEAGSKKKVALVARADEAEKKLQELNLRFEQLEKTNDEQKLRIMKTQRALELAEKELKRAHLEANSKFEKLTKVHGSWLPPWLVINISHVQDLAVTFWKAHAKPSMIALINKTSVKMVHAKEWSEPHIYSAKTKWVPAAKQQFEIFMTNMEPYMKELSTKTIEVYEVSKITMKPHFDKVQEMALSYYKEAWSYLKPYIDQIYIVQIYIVTKPYVEKLQISLKPYTKYATRVYHKLRRRTKAYHRQVKNNIYKHLRKHELTRAYATMGLASVMAYVLLAFPVFFLYRFLQSIFFTKKRKQIKRTSHASKPQRRPKRRHADKKDEY